MIEMMFAILILSIVIMGLMGVLGSVLRNQTEGRIYERVSVAANIVFGRAGLALSENFEKPLVPEQFADGRQPVPHLDEVSFSISETRERDDLKRVDVVLFWRDSRGVEHQKTMSTKFLKGR